MTMVWQRYILREYSLYFLAALASLSLIMVSNTLIRMGSSTLEKGVSIADMASLMILTLPSGAYITIPVSALIAAMSLSSTLNRNHEMVILYSAGISPGKVISTIMIASFAVTAIAVFNSFVLAPTASKHIQEIYLDMAENVSYRILSPGVFNKLDNTTLYYQQLGPEGFQNVLVGQKHMVVSAKSGTLEQGEESLILLLRNGTIVDTRSSQNYIQFDYHEIPVQTAINTLQMSRGMMSIEQLKQSGRQRDILEIHKRYALSLSAFLFGLLGFMLGARGGRTGKGASILTSLLIVLVFYIVRAIAMYAMDYNFLPPSLVEWVSPAVMSVLTLVTYLRFQRNIL
ncbi:LptF/LptG family permease [Desulfurispira natronophila]|uniref:Lipopolysaccharide export system permease protein n=1 Tax=Desulfurispira natronophila TaxID=682562 RepID=A0A7W7Y323_9BACT|nr:LptF/LptG family permease [Desulfurispira natronophila]MBB5021024.1 lipopolysaccharide export system permease protein [Desulfurispira natronophila]